MTDDRDAASPLGDGRDLPPVTVARIEARSTRLVTPCGAGTMVWHTWGEGQPLLLLHGATGSWMHWIRNVEVLAAHVRVIAPDMPGYGDSDLPSDHSAESLADVIAAGLDTLVPAPARIDIAGFSFGGIIGGLVAARPGNRVRTLVLIGPNGLALPIGPTRPLSRVHPAMTPEESRETHRENLRILMLARPERADDLAVHVQMENVRQARFRSGGIPTSDALLRALPRVKARIAGIWGARDAFGGPYLDDRRRTLATFQPDLDFRVIENAGHWVIYETPTEVNAALLDILDHA